MLSHVAPPQVFGPLFAMAVLYLFFSFVICVAGIFEVANRTRQNSTTPCGLVLANCFLFLGLIITEILFVVRMGDNGASYKPDNTTRYETM
jgi:hypothetical protein